MKLNHHPLTPDEIKVLAMQYLEAELKFFQNHIDGINNRIKQLKVPGAAVTEVAETDSGSDGKGKRLSSAARQRISEAQKERWAKVHKEKRAAEKTAAKEKVPAKRRSRAIAAGQAASPASDPEE